MTWIVKVTQVSIGKEYLVAVPFAALVYIVVARGLPVLLARVSAIVSGDAAVLTGADDFTWPFRLAGAVAAAAILAQPLKRRGQNDR